MKPLDWNLPTCVVRCSIPAPGSARTSSFGFAMTDNEAGSRQEGNPSRWTYPLARYLAGSNTNSATTGYARAVLFITKSVSPRMAPRPPCNSDPLSSTSTLILSVPL